MKYKIILIFILLIPLFIFSITAKTTELIGVPTAGILKNGQLDASLYLSGAFKFSQDSVPFDYNLSISYGLLDMMDVSLHMYTITDFTLQAQMRILEEKENLPELSVGMKNITYEKYIDEGGGGDTPTSGFYDYSYSTRSSDWFSLYLVATKDFDKAGKYTIGLGRGEFVGYGRGRYLSTVAFFDTSDLSDNIVNEFMFSFFGGAEIPIIEHLSFIGDVDGRDVNFGLRYYTDNISANVAITHAELFTSNDPDQRPRIDAGINYIFDLGGKKEKYGYLSINIKDNLSNKLIPAKITFEGMKTKPIVLKTGKVKMKLKPGKYTIKIESAGYKWQKRVFSIVKNATNELNIKMNKKNNIKQKQHDKAIALAKQAKKMLNNGDVVNAIAKLSEAKTLAPNDPTILAYIKEANSMKKSMISTHRNNAIAYEKKGWIKSALNEWNAILILDKNNKEAKNAVSKIQAKLDAEKKKKETAKKNTTTKKKQDPEKLYQQGYKYFLDGEYEKAIKKFEAVLEINPNHKKAKKYLKKAKDRL